MSRPRWESQGPVASKWVNRWRRHGEVGLYDKPSTPRCSPNTTPVEVIERIEDWRREHKWSAQRITHELFELGYVINRRTVTRHLTRLGLGQRRFLDPNGVNNSYCTGAPTPCGACPAFTVPQSQRRSMSYALRTNSSAVSSPMWRTICVPR